MVKLNQDRRLSDGNVREVDQGKLERLYTAWEKGFLDHIKQGFSRTDKKAQMQKLAAQARDLGKKNSKAWATNNMLDISKVVFAIVSLQRTPLNTEASTIWRPNVAQVFAVFAMFGVGFKLAPELKNNLLEVGTGEGKSIILAVAACCLALSNWQVSVACYSPILSGRDERDFVELYTTLGIAENIRYGTFQSLCESRINEACDLRATVNGILHGAKTEVIAAAKPSKKHVLLIDEVDVFLTEEFFGSCYTPGFLLRSEQVESFLFALWESRGEPNLRLPAVVTWPTYQALLSRYPNDLILELVKSSIQALHTFSGVTYAVKDDQIVYIDGDVLAGNVNRGAATTWHYFQEYERGNISKASLLAHCGFPIKCGVFAYSEIVRKFDLIAGTSGTLHTLSEPERKILSEIYNFQRNTYLPSVFGASRLQWRSADPSFVTVVTRKEFNLALVTEIEHKLLSMRPVLVFFECKAALVAFATSEEFSRVSASFDVIAEGVSEEEQDDRVKSATCPGKITLITRTYGRGTDFVCNNPKVIDAGGVHLIHTFFSTSEAEEFQIRGRCARQGDPGSYRLLLVDADLEWIDSDWLSLAKTPCAELYERLRSVRSKMHTRFCESLLDSSRRWKPQHEESEVFRCGLLRAETANVIDTLLRWNSCAPALGSCQTMLLIDGTGSMALMLSLVKQTLAAMFERTSIILQNFGKLPFSLQLAVYRDYDTGPEGILQTSAWESEPLALLGFLAGIKAHGGGDYEEAIEIGLQHAVAEAKKHLTQVLLIGDAPAKDTSAITRDRHGGGGEESWVAKFGPPQTWQVPAAELKALGVPVHTHYLCPRAQKGFEAIAEATGGTASSLDIASDACTHQLVHQVTQQLVAASAGPAAVEAYRKTYMT